MDLTAETKSSENCGKKHKNNDAEPEDDHSPAKIHREDTHVHEVVEHEGIRCENHESGSEEVVDQSDSNTEYPHVALGQCVSTSNSFTLTAAALYPSAPSTFSDYNNNCDPAAVYDENDQKAAADIVRKLCKNGKVMEFGEDDNCFKVIVYQDDDADSQSEDEGQSGYCPRSKTLGGRGQSRNLLDCLLEKSGRIKENSTPSKLGFGTHSEIHCGNLTPGTFQSGAENIPTAFPGLSEHQLMYNTPLARSSYMFYSESPALTSTPQPSRTIASTPNRMVTPGVKGLQLNSSGEEVSPSDQLSAPSSEQLHNRVRTLMHMPQFQEEDTGKMREQHNQKERRRRARIKEACNLLRQLVPGMSDKTDKATVFEFAARYVHFLKSHTGAQFDKDFLMKYSPY